MRIVVTRNKYGYEGFIKHRSQHSDPFRPFYNCSDVMISPNILTFSAKTWEIILWSHLIHIFSRKYACAQQNIQVLQFRKDILRFLCKLDSGLWSSYSIYLYAHQ